MAPLLDGKPVLMEINTVAAVSLVSEAVYNKTLQHLPLKPSTLILKTYTGEPVPTKGVIDVTVQLTDRQCTVRG